APFQSGNIALLFPDWQTPQTGSCHHWLSGTGAGSSPDAEPSNSAKCLVGCGPIRHNGLKVPSEETQMDDGRLDERAVQRLKGPAWTQMRSTFERLNETLLAV